MTHLSYADIKHPFRVNEQAVALFKKATENQTRFQRLRLLAKRRKYFKQ